MIFEDRGLRSMEIANSKANILVFDFGQLNKVLYNLDKRKLLILDGREL